MMKIGDRHSRDRIGAAIRRVTPTDLRSRLSHPLTGAIAHDEAYGLEQIGEVEKRPSVENIHSDWRLMPDVSVANMSAIESTVAVM